MISDIWFISGLSLDDLASRLGLADIHADAENYWEWVIGTLPELGVSLDITRTHTVPAAQTDTRIFVWSGAREMSAELVAVVVERLRAAAISPVHTGRWIYTRGDEYDLQIVRTHS